MLWALPRVVIHNAHMILLHIVLPIDVSDA